MKPTTIKLALTFLLGWSLPLVVASQGWAQSWCSQPEAVKSKLTESPPNKEEVVKCGITVVPALTEILKNKDELIQIRRYAAFTLLEITQELQTRANDLLTSYKSAIPAAVNLELDSIKLEKALKVLESSASQLDRKTVQDIQDIRQKYNAIQDDLKILKTSSSERTWIENSNQFLWSIIRLIVTAILFLIVLIWIIYGLYNLCNIKGDKIKKKTIILPFESSNVQEQNHGKSVVDLLVIELQNIKELHSERSNSLIKDIPDELRFSSLSVYVQKEEIEELIPQEILGNIGDLNTSTRDLNLTIEQVGPIRLGANQLSLDKIFRLLWPWYFERTITGSVQKYGSTLKLVARVQVPESRILEVSSQDDNNYDKLPQLVRDIAFRIIHELSKENIKKTIKTNTWQSFKHLSEALDSHYKYQQNQQQEYLNRINKQCREAIKFETSHDYIFTLLCQVGIDLFQREKYSDAEKIFKYARKLKPDDRLATVGQRESASEARLFQTVLEDFKKMETESDAGFLAQRGVFFNKQSASSFSWLSGETDEYKQKNNKQALKYLKTALDQVKPDSNFPHAFIHAHLGAIQGRIAYSEASEKEREQYYKDSISNLEEAIKLYNQLLEKHQRDTHICKKLNKHQSWAIGSLGITHLLQAGDEKEYETALDSLDKSIELNPELKWAYTNRGELYRQRGQLKPGSLEDFDKSLDDYEKAVRLDKKNALVIANRGLTYFLRGCRGDLDKALNDFNKAIEIDYKIDWAWAKRGLIYLLKGNYKEALNDINEAIKRNKKRDWYLYNRALVYKAKFELDEANVDLEKAIDLAEKRKQEKPNDSRNTFNLALYHLVKGETNYAIILYREAVKGASKRWIGVAICDLEKFLDIFPKCTEARNIQDCLKEELTRSKSMTDNSYPLVVELWENLNYTGKYICIVEDTPDLGTYNFKNISSIKIHPGPNFDPKAIYEVIFSMAANYQGDELYLSPGAYPDLKSTYPKFSKANNICSVKFNPPKDREKPPLNISLVAELYEDSNWTGKKLIVVEDIKDLTEYNFDKVKSVRVKKGPNYTPGTFLRLYSEKGYGNGHIDLYPDGGTNNKTNGEYDLKDNHLDFADKALSVKIVDNTDVKNLQG